MKFRIASSIVLAVGLAFGATSCGLIAPQATLDPYAPSDGINLDIAGVNVRNLMLIADESGRAFNVVMGTVNSTGTEQEISIAFMEDGDQLAKADVLVPTGNASFGDPEGELDPVVVKLRDVLPGQTVKIFVQAPGSSDVPREIPVLDGQLAEYEDYVLPKGFSLKQKVNGDRAEESDS